MNFFNKYEKGEYPYAKYNMKKTWIVTCFLYALSASIYIMGYVTTHTNKNLLTIVAVLGILPASKSMISAIMNSRVKTVDESLKNSIDEKMDGLSGMYHLYLTSYDNNFYLAHCVVTNDSLICFTDDKKFSVKAFDEHIKKHLKIEGVDGILIKVFDNKEAYLNRLEQLHDITHNKNCNKKVYDLLKAISL